MAATPRKFLFDPNTPLFYHLVSRCVRRAYLCGYDPTTGKDYSYRKQWLIDRMNFLVQYFAVDLYGYAIMSNHFHLALYHDPKAHLHWSRDEVADRWLAVSPPPTWGGKPVTPELLATAKADLLSDRKRLTHVRKQLGSMSTFMKFLKQDIARRANLEDEVAGHFFEQRFWSAALVSERSILSAMAYIDLNPFRVGIAKTIEDIQDASLTERLAIAERDAASLDAYLKPLRSGLLPEPPRVSMTLKDYVETLRAVTTGESIPGESGSVERWRKDIAGNRQKQRAYGTQADIEVLASRHGWKRAPPSVDA
jgi:REP element-mobilizing transposase RayT